MEYLSNTQWADIWGKKPDNSRKLLHNYGVALQKRKTAKTMEGYVNVSDLLPLVEKGKVTREQYERAVMVATTGRASTTLSMTNGVEVTADGKGKFIDGKKYSNELLYLHAKYIADAVCKRFGALEELSPSEIESLDIVCAGWMRMKKEDIKKRVCSVCGVSRSWLGRPHKEDLRTKKEKAYEKMTSVQRDQVNTYKLKAHTTVSFVDKCKRDETLPRLSDRTWYRIANYLNTELQDELMLVHQGAITLRQNTEPNLRDRTYLAPLEVIIGDFTRIDRIIKWHDGTLVTPYLCVWSDWRTNAIVGAAITKHPNSLGVKTSLFDCFSKFGVCQTAFMDNGKEFKGYTVVGDSMEQINYKIDFEDDVERTIKDFTHKGFLPAMGVQWMRAIVKNPRSKPVERIFGRGGFTDWAKEFGDWVGSKYWEMPETIAKAITKYRQGKAFIEPLSGKTIYFSDLLSLAATVNEFINHHNTRPSDGFGMDKKAPLQIWNELVLETPPRKANVHDLGFHFLDGDTRKVRGSSHIEFKKHFFYRSDALWNHRLETVYYRYNPVDGYWWTRGDKKQFEFMPNSLLIYDMEGKYLCEAVPVERLHPTKALNISATIRKQNETARDAKDHVRHLLRSPDDVNDLLASSNPSVPPVELVEAMKEAEEVELVKSEKEKEKYERMLTKKYGIIEE